jgi:hypothetical protein
LAIDLPIEDLAAEVHPDGRHIAFVSGSGRNREIRLFEGFLPPSARSAGIHPLLASPR